MSNRKGNTDGDETVLFRKPNGGKSTDQYDTQTISAAEIRRRGASQSGQCRSRYGVQDDNPDIYRGSGVSRTNYTGNGYSQRTPQGDRRTYGSTPRSSQNQNRQGTSRSSQSAYGNNNAAYGAAYYAQGQQNRRNSAQAQGTRQQSARQNTPPRQQRPPEASRQHPKKQSSFFGRLVRFILVLVILLFLLYSLIAMIGILGMNRVSTGERSVTDGSLDASYVKSVLVIGTDSRDPEEDRGRSDSMILVSLNSKTQELSMTSFMRDAYVDIPGNGSGKLNAAYSYGGAELLMDTIEENYDVHIDDYVLITFAACADMIDAVGGIELTISDEEAQAVNEILISEVNEIMGDDREDDLLESGGTLTLDGKQALSYSRIRYVGNADFERTQRQRTVMSQVMTKAKQNPFRLASICMTALPQMTTNMSVFSLYSYAVTTPIKLLLYETQQLRVPADGTFSNATINGESVLQVDFDAAREQLAEMVFGES